MARGRFGDRRGPKKSVSNLRPESSMKRARSTNTCSAALLLWDRLRILPCPLNMHLSLRCLSLINSTIYNIRNNSNFLRDRGVSMKGQQSPRGSSRSLRRRRQSLKGRREFLRRATLAAGLGFVAPLILDAVSTPNLAAELSPGTTDQGQGEAK